MFYVDFPRIFLKVIYVQKFFSNSKQKNIGFFSVHSFNACE
jgi:hypothetical protein